MNPHFSLPARDVHLMAACLDERGVDSTSALQRMGIDRKRIRHPDAVLRPAQVAAAIRALMALDDQANLALLAGKKVNIGALGTLGRAMSLSNTGASALALCARFYASVSLSVEMHIAPIGEWYAMRWVPVRALPQDLLRVAFDMTLGAMHSRLASAQKGAPPGCRRLLAGASFDQPGCMQKNLPGAIPHEHRRCAQLAHRGAPLCARSAAVNGTPRSTARLGCPVGAASGVPEGAAPMA